MTTLEEHARSFAKAHPKHGTQSWNQACAALMFEVNGGHHPYDTAHLAYKASTIVSTSASDAPIGAVHYWALGDDGHVGLDLRGSSTHVFMATSALRTQWADFLGTNSVSGYTKAKRSEGAKYLGWALSYGVNPVFDASDVGKKAVAGIASVGEPEPVPAPTFEFVKPSLAEQKKIQALLRLKGFYPPPLLVNGKWGTHSVAAIQRALAHVGFYDGAINGIPGPLTCKAVQEFAAKHGSYTGPQNQILGPNSWSGFYRALAKVE